MYPKLSIVCISYNQAKFIRQTLDGFVMQKTDFPFEVLIHDDASTDGTTDIIREYASKYPEIIKPIYQKENQYNKGKDICKHYVFPYVKGKYVALCEGDDYWTDENKLQKQVNFLEAHPDYSICFHPVEIKWEDGSNPDSLFPNDKMRFYKDTLDLGDLLHHNFIQTNSVVYRWRFHKDSLDLIPDNVLPGDWFLHLLHAQVGKIGFIPDIMAVYRRHSGGVWYNNDSNPECYCRYYRQKINFYTSIKKQFGCVMKASFYDTVYKAYYAAIILDKQEVIADLENQFNFLSKPPSNKCFLLLNILKLKIKSKLENKSIRIQTKQKYKALKLYRKWRMHYINPK